MRIAPFLKMRSAGINKILIFLILSGLSFTIVFSQEAIPSAGGEARGTGGKASITVGQAIYTTYSGNPGSVSQGVQQAYIITVVAAAKTSLADNLSCRIFPNPVQEALSLEISGEVGMGLFYKLYDSNGKLLVYRAIDAKLTFIPMGQLPPSSYLLKIEAKDQPEIKSFKIIKR